MTKSKSNQSHSSGLWWKIGIVAVVLGAAAATYAAYGDRLLGYLAGQEDVLRAYQAEHPILVFLVAFLLYVTVTGLSLPGAAALSLVYGWYFGFWRGLVLVSFASTAGATVAFLFSRYLFREALQSRFGERLAAFNEALDREGAFYLFSLRLIPAIPFFVINVVMGLTRFPVVTFWWVSQVGMLAGTVVYLYAGSSIPTLNHLADPSQLKATDVRDWNSFTAQLRDERDTQSGAGVLWRGLSASTQQSLRQTDSLTDQQLKETVIREINQMLASPELMLAPAWQTEVLPVREDEPSRMAAAKQLSKINRSILVAAFPETVSPPRPILSTKLLIAFAGLGLFPLLVKKIMQRFRSTPVAEQDQG